MGGKKASLVILENTFLTCHLMNIDIIFDGIVHLNCVLNFFFAQLFAFFTSALVCSNQCTEFVLLGMNELRYICLGRLIRK